MPEVFVCLAHKDETISECPLCELNALRKQSFGLHGRLTELRRRVGELEAALYSTRVRK